MAAPEEPRGESRGPAEHAVARERATVLLNLLAGGDRSVESELVPLLYGELRLLAEAHMADQKRGHTLQPTALVHEVWLRLAGTGFAASDPKGFGSRSQFFALASRAMRSILVDHARARAAQKRGGGRRIDAGMALGDLPQEGVLEGADGLDLLALDEALERLAAQDQELARVVELRFFAGLTNGDVGAMLDLPLRTVERRWRLARAWLHGELTR